MSLNDINIIEFLNKYKKKLSEEKQRLESYAKITDNNNNVPVNVPSVLSNGCEKAVNNIKKTPNNDKTEQSCEKKITDSRGIENTSMLRKETNITNNNGQTNLSEETYLGFGEYEKRRQKYLEERRLDYKEYLEKQKQNCLQKSKKHCDKRDMQNNLTESRAEIIYSPDVNLNTNIMALHESKSVQTDIFDDQLLKTNVLPNNTFDVSTSISDENSDKEYFDMNAEATRPNQLAVKIDKVQIGTQNIIVPGFRNSSFNSNGFTREISPKARHLADLKHTYFPNFTKSNENPNDTEDYQIKKLKWEKARQHEEYHEELRKQIEEKQRIALEIAERERCQEAALTRRVEKQLQQLRLEQEDEKTRQGFEENYHHYVERNRPKNYHNKREFYNFDDHPIYSKVNSLYQPHKSQSENSLCNKNSKKVPYSFNIPENSIFTTESNIQRNKISKENRYMGETVTPTNLNANRRAANNSKSPKPILDDSFSVPILRAKSPSSENVKCATNIHKELNLPNSPAMQQVEAKWMIPAVQKNIVKRSHLPSIGESKNVLTQLGAIRLQLQQEQLRLNQSLKNNTKNNSK